MSKGKYKNIVKTEGIDRYIYNLKGRYIGRYLLKNNSLL